MMTEDSYMFDSLDRLEVGPTEFWLLSWFWAKLSKIPQTFGAADTENILGPHSHIIPCNVFIMF